MDKITPINPEAAGLERREHTNELGVTALTTGHDHKSPYCMAKAQDEFLYTRDYHSFSVAHTKFDEWKGLSVRDVSGYFTANDIKHIHYSHVNK